MTWPVGGEGRDCAGGAGAGPSAKAPPAWAQTLRRRQAVTQNAATAARSIGSGDGQGAGSAPDISEKE